MIFQWDMAIYRFSKWRPSAILELFYHHTRPLAKSLLLAAAACQMSCQSDTQIWRYSCLNFSRIWLKMTIQVPEIGVLGDFGSSMIFVFSGLCRHVTILTPIVIFCCLTVFWLFLTVFDDWNTVGTVLVDMRRLVHQWWFLLFWLSFDCFWLFLINGTLYQSSKTLKTISIPIVTGLPRLYQQCTNGVPIVKNSQKTVKTAKRTIGVPIVTCLQGCTNSVPTMYQSSKTVKTAKMTIGVPIVTCLPRLYQQCTNRQKQSKAVKSAQKWPLVYQSSFVAGLPRLYQQCNNNL